MTYPMPAEMQASPALAEAPMAGRSYSFTRPGQRPLSFSGRELAIAMSFTPEIPYWYEIAIYRTDANGFALVIKMFFQSESEEDYTKAWHCESLAEAFDILEAYDAAEDIKVGVDPSHYETAAELAYMALELKARIASQRAHWASLIGEFFEEMQNVTQ